MIHFVLCSVSQKSLNKIYNQLYKKSKFFNNSFVSTKTDILAHLIKTSKIMYFYIKKLKHKLVWVKIIKHCWFLGYLDRMFPKCILRNFLQIG